MADTKIDLVDELQALFVVEPNEDNRFALARIIKKAEGGYYDDYTSLVPFSKMELVKDLYLANQPELAIRVREGEFNE